MHLNISLVSLKRYSHTWAIAVLTSALIIGIAATLGRATVDLRGAISDNPDLAILLLLEEQDINVTESTFLSARGNLRDYLVETETGPRWVRLNRGPTHWYIQTVENLHE